MTAGAVMFVAKDKRILVWNAQNVNMKAATCLDCCLRLPHPHTIIMKEV